MQDLGQLRDPAIPARVRGGSRRISGPTSLQVHPLLHPHPLRPGAHRWVELTATSPAAPDAATGALRPEALPPSHGGLQGSFRLDDSCPGTARKMPLQILLRARNCCQCLGTLGHLDQPTARTYDSPESPARRGQMAIELLEFENPVEDSDGLSWWAVVLGAERANDTWIGWIRFRNALGDLVETDRETSQPKREDLVYWSTGLTYAYLVGALERAQRRAHAPPTGHEATSAIPDAGPRLEIMGAPEQLLNALIGPAGARPGSVNYIGESGALVYEGRSGESPGDAHYFALRFGSRNSGAILANWLWSTLKGTGATIRIDGQPVEMTQPAMSHAIAGP
jgi:hypothetical protein